MSSQYVIEVLINQRQIKCMKDLIQKNKGAKCAACNRAFSHDDVVVLDEMIKSLVHARCEHKIK